MCTSRKDHVMPCACHKKDDSFHGASSSSNSPAFSYTVERRRKRRKFWTIPAVILAVCIACFASSTLSFSLRQNPLALSWSPTYGYVHEALAESHEHKTPAVFEPSFTPIIPPSYPLAVRNPYLSAWLPGSAAANLPLNRPQFWAGQELNWAILARIDNQTYTLFGVPAPYGFRSKAATVLGGDYSSTRTTFTLLAGVAQFTLEFFSPVSPNNYLRQSLPFSYLKVSVSVLHGSKPSIQIYSDIDQSWTGQLGNTRYKFKTSGSTSMYEIGVKNAADYSEDQNMALWGEVIWAATNASKTLSAAAGPVQDVRGQFARDGFLRPHFPAWTGGGGEGFTRQHTVAGLTHNLGIVKKEASATFAIGYVREKAINYLQTPQTHYYRAVFPKTIDAVKYFFNDYDNASKESKKLDKAIEKAGIETGGQKYADILTLSLRQILGGIDITIPHDTLDVNKAFAFIKECSSNGNINTMDIIYPTFPVFYLLNPDLLRLMLEPVMVYLDSGRYAANYTIHDLGTHYPNATGHDLLREEKMPLEESGNLLIMANAYHRVTNDTAWIKKYYHLFQLYADYLVEKGLYPEFQLSTNDAIGALSNQTNLAIKAAVGLAAWGNLTAQKNYTKTAHHFAKTILDVGTDANQTYFKLAYDRDSWFLVFNLYPDKLLGLGAFPERAHRLASAYHATARGAAGVALGGAFRWAKTDWQLFAAGGADDPAVRQMFVDDLWAFIANGLNTEPLSDRYWVDDELSGGILHLAGAARNFRARPTLGAHFAILAREWGGKRWEWDA